MELRVFTEPYHGATYGDLLRAARHAEACGFDGFFVADHYHPMHFGDGLPGPTDAWTTLAGLARETSAIRLGTLMTSATFRHPGPLAVTAAQVDAMSGGRIELGFGAGWFGLDHSAYGIPFPAPAERFERMEEQLQILTGLWTTPPGERFSFEGRHYRLTDSPALPKPAQRPRIPLIIGGRGPRRTPALAARHADEFNLPFTGLEQSARLYAGARAARARVPDRPPLTLSVALGIACGRTEPEIATRLTVLHEQSRLPPEEPLHGSPARITEQLGAYAELGVTRIYVRLRDLTDLTHLDLLMSEVAPQLPSV
ncbi:LLM class F420-dependent oxidoreductase [Streptomyces europaeiscabiei]|uniref:LLM class F420-dependent oxidoreductase n=1 Tax=Streptomyces europaeiscabiei TaxID=146819 RepID=A0ABU4NKS8_9ACTN|nr:LLM class F420-dependent oxidoreductase [Streptomyces europaeiscabiei]MDX2528658.1 LLM class F420-dependent oxidoreductase [Streptomyces europaeiscabiei]MDX2763237.1 LLM class F420-dependent oxidoreductase [Streptomyces europaeiscabiei]MDX2772542.1 LLM class F420-dependent oxidoreductase [Streptomyces europaeiscabiei]MDX3548884.1 LLM class F420-dependent oxidoreductase [Streptomyces europaeiscabiei]MDX3555825.1 LLM class F420-dependent oxidoreductase [Streptomyces europaeiscabiei]